jgi:hypothetical protein
MGIGWDDPHWKGDVFVITHWDAAGFDFEEEVLPTIASICRSLPEPPKSLTYFNAPIARNHAKRLEAAKNGFSAKPQSVRSDFHDDLVDRQNAAIAAVFQEEDE